MNTSVIQKCITELQKESPDLSYLRGMLETLLEMQDKPYSLGTAANVYPTKYEAITASSFPPTGKLVTADSPEGMAVEAALAGLTGMPQPNLGSLTIEKNITLN